jgi:hypothetical protein
MFESTMPPEVSDSGARNGRLSKGHSRQIGSWSGLTSSNCPTTANKRRPDPNTRMLKYTRLVLPFP